MKTKRGGAAVLRRPNWGKAAALPYQLTGLWDQEPNLGLHEPAVRRHGQHFEWLYFRSGRGYHSWSLWLVSLMKKIVIWLVAALLAAAAVLQFFNPALTNPPVAPGEDLMASNAPPAEIAALLHNACYDCHSYTTTWPWYSHVAPLSWFLTSHVSDAREAMNFSAWPHGDAYKEGKRWTKISHQVDNGSMPLASYTWMHPASRLTQEQRKQLSDWAAKEAERLK
jgi:hypothetical protein